MAKRIHIAIDFDKTLAYHESEWGISKIGEPIQPMVDLVKQWLSKGYRVTIFTARANKEEHSPLVYLVNVDEIRVWLKENGLPEDLEITAVKSRYFTHIVDDRAYHVERNAGIISDNFKIE